MNISRTLKITISSLVFGMAAASVAVAQSSSGNISGEAIAGDTVVIRGPDNGFHRELQIEKDGKYRVGRVPTGDYDVTIQHADGTVEQKPTVTVRVGSTARVH